MQPTHWALQALLELVKSLCMLLQPPMLATRDGRAAFVAPLRRVRAAAVVFAVRDVRDGKLANCVNAEYLKHRR